MVVKKYSEGICLPMQMTDKSILMMRIVPAIFVIAIFFLVHRKMKMVTIWTFFGVIEKNGIEPQV